MWRHTRGLTGDASTSQALGRLIEDHGWWIEGVSKIKIFHHREEP
jgi:hypothetical protein